VTHQDGGIDQVAVEEIPPEGAMTRVITEDEDPQNEEEGILVTDEEETLVTGEERTPVTDDVGEAVLTPIQTETITNRHVVIPVGEAGEMRTIWWTK